MDGILKQLNSEFVTDAILGLKLLNSNVSLAEQYLTVSPLAFEITRAWCESKHEEFEEEILKTLTLLMSSCSNQRAIRKLAWGFLKSEKILDRLKLCLERKKKQTQLSVLKLLLPIVRLDSGIGREIQLKFDFNLIVTEVEKKTSKVKKNISVENQIENEKKTVLAQLTSSILEFSDEIGKKVCIEGPLSNYCIENLQLVSGRDIEMFFASLKFVIHNRILISTKFLANMARCLHSHPDEIAKGSCGDFLKYLLSIKQSASNRLIEFLDPIQDERHAEMLELCVKSSKSTSLSHILDTKKGVGILEPRASFPWFRNISLICRLLLSCPPKSSSYSSSTEAMIDVVPSESLFSKACFHRGLLFPNNDFVQLFTMDLLIHVLYRSKGILDKIASPSEKRRFSDSLTKRLPEVSLIVNFRNFDKRNPKGEILFLRSLRILELYGDLNISCRGFDPLKYLPKEGDSLTWARLSKMLLIQNRNVLPDDWLKNVEPELVVLGSLLISLAKQKDSMVEETQKDLIYLACQVLQSIGAIPAPRDASSASSILIGQEEVIVSEKAKKWVYWAIQTPDSAEEFNSYLIQMKKNKRFELSSVEAATIQDNIDWGQFDKVNSNSKLANIPDDTLRALSKMLDENPDNQLYQNLFKHFIGVACSNPNKFSSLKVVHSLLVNQPKLSASSLLELNSILDLASCQEQNWFGIHQEILEILRVYAKPLLSNKNDELLAKMAKLFSEEDRKKIASHFCSGSNFKALNILLLEVELNLLFEEAIILFVMKNHDKFEKVLELAAEKFPSKLALWSHVLEKIALSDWKPSIVTRLAQTPGKFSFAVSKDPKFLQLYSNDLLSTSSATLRTELEKLEISETTHLLRPGSRKSLSTTVLLENYSKFPSLISQELLSRSSKKDFDKTIAKQFMLETFKFSEDVSRLQILSHLVRLERLKAKSVYKSFVVNSDSFCLEKWQQADLFLKCIQSDERCINKGMLPFILKSYHASLSRKDLILRKILEVFEAKVNCSPLMCGWAFGEYIQLDILSLEIEETNIPDVIKQHYAWVTDSLDPTRLKRKFKLDEDENEEDTLLEGEKRENVDFNYSVAAYDPYFLLRVFNHTLGLFAISLNLPHASVDQEEINQQNEMETEQEEHPSKDSNFVIEFPSLKWLQGGHVEYILQSLSSNDALLRELGYSCLQRFAQLVTRDSHLKEKDQVALVFRALRAAISTPYQQIPPLIISYVTEYLHIAWKGTTHPQWKQVNQFLFTDEGFVLNDLPSFYTTFNSGTKDFEQDRHFTLRILARGIRTRLDLKVLRRRYILNILMSSFDSSMSDNNTRKLILQIFLTCSKIVNGGAVEILKQGFLPFSLGVLSNIGKTQSIWYLADDRGVKEEEEADVVLLLFEIVEQIAKARTSLFTRMLDSRNNKRLRSSFPRCEWGTDETEFIFVSRQLIEFLSIYPQRNTKLTEGLVEIIFLQKETLKLSINELRTLHRFVVGENLKNLRGKFIEIVMNTCETTDLDDCIIRFIVVHCNSDNAYQVFTWMASHLSQIKPEYLPVDSLLDAYGRGFIGDCLVSLNRCCIAALLHKFQLDTKEQATYSKLMKIYIPKMLQNIENPQVNDVLSVALREALSGMDGKGFMKLVKEECNWLFQF